MHGPNIRRRLKITELVASENRPSSECDVGSDYRIAVLIHITRLVFVAEALRQEFATIHLLVATALMTEKRDRIDVNCRQAERQASERHA
jgi:hypothetical protein